MGYLFSVAVGLIGGLAAVGLIERRRSNKRRRARSRATNTAGDEKRTAGKVEFAFQNWNVRLIVYEIFCHALIRPHNHNRLGLCGNG